ncbi:MAG: pyruvate dehydrogenase E2 component (dihydrolipoamide acetyltransferase) [Woeseiaceae bacterium]|jgi:pyruvate dehydrogenase E2 component (dihydrolipoamide acetyltransferase)|tara:strand:- start:16814 stop:18124 length:1311 start_codon:yes stop_codon:yes gene_type:complete
MSNKLTNLIDIKIPDVGDFDSIEVIEILVSKGDSVKIEESLITLETDKASMDIPSPETGEINSLNVKVGDLVKKDDIIGNIKIIGSTKSKIKNQPLKESENSQKTTEAITNSQPLNHQPPKHPSTTRTLPVIDEKQFTTAHASPSVRKFARELGVNLVEVNGSGTKSRILHEDIKGFVKAILSGASFSGSSLPKVPTVDYAKYGEIVIEPLSRIQKISGPRLQASWINLPHVTQHDFADITEMEKERLRQKNLAKNKKLKISPLAFIIKACALTLENFPRVNASLTDDGKSLVLKKYINIGFAADTKNGLVVPVINNVDNKSILDIARELNELSELARSGKLSADKMQGATFTVSSLGGIGGTAFTPIINAPEVAILGISRAAMQPIWDGKEFNPRLMLPLSFSYDHRVIDGASAARFTTFFGQQVIDIKTLVKGG